jgi:hypothetical protein
MKRFARLLLVLCLAGLLAGCGNEKEKGINKDQDQPRSGAGEKSK